MSEAVKKSWRKGFIAIALLAACIVAGVCVRYWPRATLASRIPSSIAVFAADGELLRLTMASDQQYRIWTPLENISPQLVEALLLHEDRHFYYHLGVNPIALVRAVASTYSGTMRQGGSTLSMQLARLLYGLKTRTVVGKCKQILLAIGLELRYSKHDLLEAHLNLMPYGGNLQGVGAASLVYFRKSADKLVLSQALSLVLIPQSPSRRDPGDHEPDALRAARARLFVYWEKEHPEAAADAQLITMPLRYGSIEQLPFVAPHLTTQVLGQILGNADAAKGSQTQREIRTTIDLPTQRSVEQIVNAYVHEQSRIGIHNASLLLVDSRDMSVRAMVGSADFYSTDIQGQVNGSVAKRSPGSMLKPFIYALAMDQGLIHPLSVLKDAPLNFGGYSPENFDGRFAGPVSATEALTRSRNVPAVALNARLAQPSFYQFLRTAGVARLAAENHYGLALALGGGEVTMEEAVTLYAMLANRGVLAPLRYRLDESRSEGTRLLSEEASFMTLDMLASAPRPDSHSTGNHSSSNLRLSIAWKTGTSWGFRDAWTIGVFGPYVLAVWVGNFDGSSNAAFVGVQAAAPLYFRVVDAMTARYPSMRERFVTTPEHLVRVEVCSASGDLPNADCPQVTSTWFIPGVSPIKVSQIHRRIWIDTRTGKQACTPIDHMHARSEVYEFWPSDLQQLFSQAGMPRRRPPPSADCDHAGSIGIAPHISSPVTNVTYTLRARSNDSNFVPLTANVDGDVQRVHWFVDESYVGTSAGNEALAWRTQRGGRYLVRAVDDQGRADSRELNVTFAP